MADAALIAQVTAVLAALIVFGCEAAARSSTPPQRSADPAPSGRMPYRTWEGLIGRWSPPEDAAARPSAAEWLGDFTGIDVADGAEGSRLQNAAARVPEACGC